MNSFNFTDIDKNAGVTLDAPLYYLRINETYDTPHYAAKAKARLLKMMENIRKKLSYCKLYDRDIQCGW